MLPDSWSCSAIRFSIGAGVLGFLLPLFSMSARGQESVSSAPADVSLILNTQAVSPQRFLAVHGRRSLIDGYASAGLEVWGYPFQIVSGYRVAFREAGTTTSVAGEDILSLVTYEPDSVTRVYLGPGFIVREKLFVPLNQAGAIVTYTVQSKRPIEIDVKATPVMNLMWPAAVGGQSVEWNSSLSAFVLSESTDGFTATVGSPDIVAHDDVGNRTVHGMGDAGLGFMLHPNGSGVARVYLALNPAHSHDPGVLFRSLVRDRQVLEDEVGAHVHEVMQHVLRVQTPEASVNQAIAWAEIALDQAWVCNDDLGCGYVAGYGPSRGARRPQYDWFFAGDGLIAADGALSEGDKTHAREELEFILRYQNHTSGMIWHEMSQSAGLLDWTGKYPYMYVHVDISFQFLSMLARYVAATGDVAFVHEHWQEIQAVYRYCSSVIDSKSGLPTIPADKEGGNEQDRMSDDLGLSTSWIEAASAFARLSRLTGQDALADEAAAASARARAEIPGHYWSAQQSRWISGHTQSGQDTTEFRSGPTEALTLNLFSPEQTSRLLDQLTSSDFQTDWGARGVSAASPTFDPESYSRGSVSAMHSASLAMSFWTEHRPLAAMGLWRSLLPWMSLDALGHMHEVAAGDLYRAQIESVPEQTWSSAGFLEATVHGLLGLEVDSIAGSLTFAPRLPVAWNDVAVDQIVVSGDPISLKLHRDAEGFSLKIENAGKPVRFQFAPEIPLGATAGRATFNQRRTDVVLDAHAQETDAVVNFTAPHGTSELKIQWAGGLSVISPVETPLPGAASVGVRVIDTRLQGSVFTLVADVRSDRASHLQIRTGWKVAGEEGAEVSTIAPDMLEVTFAPSDAPLPPGSYRRVQAVLHLKR